MTASPNNNKKNLKWLIVGLFTAVGASLCCIVPLLAVVAGISGFASTFPWLEPLRPYLAGTTLLVLGTAWYQRLKPKTREAIACACEEGESPSFWQTKSFLGLVTLFAVALLSFPYYSGAFFPNTETAKTVVTDRSRLVKTELTIEGMTCTGCEKHIEQAVSKGEGTIAVKADYEAGTAIVRFDSTQTSVKSITQLIDETGFTVTGHQVKTQQHE